MLKKMELIVGIGILSFSSLFPISSKAVSLSGTFAPAMDANVVQVLHRRALAYCGRPVCGCVCLRGCIATGDAGEYKTYDYDRLYYKSYYREYRYMHPDYNSYSAYYDDEQRLYYRSYYRDDYDGPPYFRVLIGK
jgi:hypothetical protein